MGWLSRLLGTSPEAKYEKYVQQGKDAVRRKRYAEAVEAYDRALAINAGQPAVWIWKIEVLVELERRNQALSCCDAALRVHPRATELWGWRAQILAELARPEEAAASFDRALETAPKDVSLHASKAFHLLYRMHLDNEVIACADQGLAVDPSHCKLLGYKAEALMNTERPEEALVCLDRALASPALDPGAKESLLRHKAQALSLLGRLEESAECERQIKNMTVRLR